MPTKAIHMLTSILEKLDLYPILILHDYSMFWLMFKLPSEVFFYLLYVEGKERYNFMKVIIFHPHFFQLHEIFQQINEFVDLNKQALVEHYILWHLESQCKTTLTLSQAVPITFARMSGAKELRIGLHLFQKFVQDWRNWPHVQNELSFWNHYFLPL